MPLLSKDYLRFDKEDAKLMQDMMKQFYDLHQDAEMPDFSVNYVGYLPVFAIALLASQQSVDKQTRVLIWLTVAIAFFTIVLAALTLALLFR